MPAGKTKTTGVELARLYTYEELAPLAGVTPRRLRRWVEDGWLGYVQLPRGRRVTGRQYMDFVEANTVAPEEE